MDSFLKDNFELKDLFGIFFVKLVLSQINIEDSLSSQKTHRTDLI